MSDVQTIDVVTLKQWLDAGEAVLIDVREIDEYTKAYIPGSVLIPVDKCGPEILPHNLDKKVVFHCVSGNRSCRACESCAREMGNNMIYNLKGGIQAWIAAGYAVKQG